MDTHVENLNHRLRGLCDNVDAGQEKFQEKEMVFSIRGTSTVPLTLRVRHSIDPNSRIPWQLRWANFYVWAKVELGPDQICGSTWDESEEHSCEKLLWYRLQQQCCRVPHWTRLQVVNKCFLWRGCVLNIHSSQTWVRVHCQGVHLQEGSHQGHCEQGMCEAVICILFISIIADLQDW